MKLQADQIKQQINALILANPELATDEQLCADMIEGETDAFEFMRKLERMRLETRCTVEVLVTVIKTMVERSNRFERREENIRKLMKQLLDTANLKKLELPEATLVIRNGSPKVIITDEEALPDYYFRIKKEPNKTLIGAALKTNPPTSVPGAVLSNAEPSLTILTR
jgi:Siphovirus Gp157